MGVAPIRRLIDLIDSPHGDIIGIIVTGSVTLGVACTEGGGFPTFGRQDVGVAPIDRLINLIDSPPRLSLGVRRV